MNTGLTAFMHLFIPDPFLPKGLSHSRNRHHIELLRLPINLYAACYTQCVLLDCVEVVKLIQRALADHRDIFQSWNGQESECLVALLKVLDLFVEAGWSEARQLTHRLEEIYR